MNKIVLLFLSLIISIHGFSKDKNKESKVPVVITKHDDGDYYYQEVIKVDSTISASEIYNRAKKWIVANVKTVDNNVLFDEKTFSIVNSPSYAVTPVSGFGWSIPNGTFDFKLHLDCKDGRYKIRMDNFMFHASGSAAMNHKTYAEANPTKDTKSFESMREDANKTVMSLQSSLEAAIKGNTEKTKEDW